MPGDQPVKRALERQRNLSNEFYFFVLFAEAPVAIRQHGGFGVKDSSMGKVI